MQDCTAVDRHWSLIGTIQDPGNSRCICMSNLRCIRTYHNTFKCMYAGMPKTVKRISHVQLLQGADMSLGSS